MIRQLLRLCEELWIEDPACRLSSLNVKTQFKRHMEIVENNLTNSTNELQQILTPNDGPWTA